MSEVSVPNPTQADWSDALLTTGTEALLGTVRNYIGPVKTPYDKRDLVRFLEAFLRRAETRDSLIALLDPLDVRIIGSSILIGPAPEQILKNLFLGELPLFELGVKVSNLLDRLLLFRYASGGRRLIAVNPLLEDELRTRALDPEVFFGTSKENPFLAEDGENLFTDTGVADARAAVALFSFLLHSPLSIRKGGRLMKKAAERAASLLPELAASPGDRLGTLAQSLSASGALSIGENEKHYPDSDAFSRILAEWGDDLPFFLAACVAGKSRDGGSAAFTPRGSNFPEGGESAVASSLAQVLAMAMESLPEGLALPRLALARWLRIVARRASLDVDPATALPTLEGLGLLRPRGGCLLPILPRHFDARIGTRPSSLVAEGSHALHLMPEASLGDRLFVSCVARPVSIGTVWSFEVERDTVRRAFAAGFTAKAIKSRFESLSGSALPQSFAFSLASWEEEYRSLRLYRGFALVADKRQRLMIERAATLGKIVVERIGPGVYFLSASTPEEAMAALAVAGLEAPPITQPTLPPKISLGVGAISGEYSARIPALSNPARKSGRQSIDALRDLFGSGSISAHATGPDPERRLAELRTALAASGRTQEERRELADRIEQRLVLTERQIAQADPRPERLEAGGLDYLGKVRVVERALRAVGDRLEVLYRLPGEEPVRALLRPVRLEKNEKGLVLEAENLGTGDPARVPLGAVSTVRRLRASLFGDD